MFFAVGFGVVSFNKKNIRKGGESIPIPLTKIYKNSKIEAQEEQYFYKIDLKDFYAKEIEINSTILFLTVENYQDQGGIYRFYSLDNDPKLLKEIVSYIRPENSDQALSKNIFTKDITGDNVPEILILIEQSASNVSEYEILTLHNSSLENIVIAGQKDNATWVNFDEISYKVGRVVRTWHGGYERGQTIYTLDGNTLREVRSVEFSLLNEDEGSCTIKEKNADEVNFRIVTEHKKNCNVWTDSFEPYF